jgi:diaminopimelate decarboxylase
VVLLIRVLGLEGAGKRSTWATTDGGMWTTAFPPTFEYHELFLCRDVAGERAHHYSIRGASLVGGDHIVRHKGMPLLRVGDVLAVMDSGAYFTSMESNLGRPRPPYVAVDRGRVRVLRAPETSADMLARDVP